ncbi:hypothetical protein SSX86_032155 [Deinandra increscens subsp. villosa]|uniref:Reverse transcriptase Ty1/copia-type domain-containing protein n=1 Tax=Deinandra increscens subsp. villosa TaxID=3103831 RepID=A0AAP0C4K7_9ASTR
MSDTTSSLLLNPSMKDLTVVTFPATLKLTDSNYLAWKTQVEALLYGLDLYKFIDGSYPAPQPVIATDGTKTPHEDYSTWFRQDRLLFGAIVGSLSPQIVPLITGSSSSRDAWETLSKTYASPTRGHIKQLKQRLKQTVKTPTQSITEYMQTIKTIVDELAILGKKMDDEDVIDAILIGLDNNAYKPIMDAVLARDTPISFSELHEKLINHELTLTQQMGSHGIHQPTSAFYMQNNSNRKTGSYRHNHGPPTFRNQDSYNKYATSSAAGILPTPTSFSGPKPYLGTCQWCQQKGHPLGQCSIFKKEHPNISVPTRNRVSQGKNTQAYTMNLGHGSTKTNWLFDSGASHHVTSDLNNLSLHAPYDGTEELVIGDGSCLKITHIGSIIINTSHTPLILTNVLCVPSISKNIISISRLCRDNNLLIQFYSSVFVIKDRASNLPVLQGQAIKGIYEFRSTSLPSQPSVFTLHKATSMLWHHRLGHPNNKVLKLLSSLVSFNSSFFDNCNSCQINKSHRLPFATSSLVSKAPLELIFSDVWCSPVESYDETDFPYQRLTNTTSNSKINYDEWAPLAITLTKEFHPTNLSHSSISSPPHSTTISSNTSNLTPMSSPNHNTSPISSSPLSSDFTSSNLSSPIHKNSSPIPTKSPSDPLPHSNLPPIHTTFPTNQSHSTSATLPISNVPPSHPINTSNPNPNKPNTRSHPTPNTRYPSSEFYLYNSSTSYPQEPPTISHALKHPSWRAAMQAEFDALQNNNTWTLVPSLTAPNLVGCKWVFRTKYKPDGTVDRLKARLVAKGFNQRPGIDYVETFSPVLKPATLRTLLSLAVSNSWPLRQLDVNNAFLQGTLNEDVFMAQPPGFINPSFPNHVCKLNKAIYGLKQASRAWYEELKTYLLSQGFISTISDSSLFIHTTGPSPLYVLVYVDDIIITGPSHNLIDHFIHSLSVKFSLKDLGSLSYFLGIEVIPHPLGLLLSQTKYIQDIINRAKMSNCKASSTPIICSEPLTLQGGTPHSSPTDYRTLVGALQYLSLTRPDIAFTVNRLSQFMHAPSSIHWQALKRLLRYLQGTSHHGFLIRKESPLYLHAFTDADWAGDKDNYRSTTGYIVYLGSNPISWSSKRQSTLARSSTEAEFRAVASTTTEVQWLSNLLTELGFKSVTTPTIYCDNLSATTYSANPVFHSRMKHLALDFHFVREKVRDGSLRVNHISGDDQLADVLTKPLLRPRFNYLISKIGLASALSILRGNVK